MRKSLERELRELEARDPAVAEAARKYDAVAKGILSRTEIPLSEVSRVLRGFLIEMNALEENLTATQLRCNELLEKNRSLRRENQALKGSLSASCPLCEAKPLVLRCEKCEAAYFGGA